jgi:hypothetical protein
MKPVELFTTKQFLKPVETAVMPITSSRGLDGTCEWVDILAGVRIESGKEGAPRQYS